MKHCEHDYHGRRCSTCRRLRRGSKLAVRGPKSDERFITFTLRSVNDLADRYADEDAEIAQALSAYRESRS
jgi:hypothetical protein